MQISATVTPLGDHVQQKTDWITLARKLYKLRQLKKGLATQESYLADRLKGLSDNKSSKGGGYAFSCFIRKGSVQYSKIEELKSIDLEPYRGKTVVMWKLTKI